MPHETTIEHNPEIDEVDADEAIEVGGVAVSSIRAHSEVDSAKLIHEEFPSVSPRPVERVGRLHYEEPEVLPEQTPDPIAHSLAEFEELLGKPLPEEVKQELTQLKAEKLETIKTELRELNGLAEQLSSSPCSRWIKDGEAVVPELATEIKDQFIKIMEQKVEEYLQTDLGQMYLKERQLEELVANYDPSDEDIQEAAKLLGITAGKTHFLPGKKSRFKETVIAKAREFLKRDGEMEELFNSRRVTPEQKKASEKARLEAELADIIQPARRLLVEQIDKTGVFNPYRLRETPAVELPGKIAQMDTAHSSVVAQLVQSVERSQLPSLLSAIVKGNITAEETYQILAKGEGSQIRQELHEVGKRFDYAETDKINDLLPEASLLGLDIDDADLALIEACFSKLTKITDLLGVAQTAQTDPMEKARDKIEKEQENFFKEIGAEYDVYWHFSPFGLRIIADRQLSPSQATGNVMTGLHSRSLHFIKPGLIGMDSMADYTSYAQAERTLEAQKPILDAFGIAVIYPLGALAEHLPYRDEPRNRDRTADDVVFRESEGAPQKSLPLKEAYILPLQTMSQINNLRSDPAFADIFEGDRRSREVLAEKVTKRALELAGFDKEWIEQHVLSTISYGEFIRSSEKEVYSEASQQLRLRLPESRAIILPLWSKPKSFETHDIGAGANLRSGQHEKLIRLEA